MKSRNLLAFLFLATPFCAHGINDYTTKQKAQFALVTVKSLARLFANQQTNDLDGRRNALLGRVVATLTHVANCMLESPRGVVSKAAHGNAALWQLLKHAEEIKMLNSVSEKLGDNDDLLDDNDESIELLQKHYYGAHGDKLINDNEDWLEGIDGRSSFSEMKKIVQFFLVAVEWCASAYSVNQRNQKKLIISQIVRSVSDLLLRYVFKDGLYKSTSNIGKIEMVTSALPHVYDAGKGAWDLYAMERDRIERIRRAEEELARMPIRCVICQDYIRDGQEMAHIDCDTRHGRFHRNCIDRWFNQDRWRNECPICRKRGVRVVRNEIYHPAPGVVIPGPDDPPVPGPQPALDTAHPVCERCNKVCRNRMCGSEHCMNECHLCRNSERMVFVAKPCNHICCRDCHRGVAAQNQCPQCNQQVQRFQPQVVQREQN